MFREQQQKQFFSQQQQRTVSSAVSSQHLYVLDDVTVDFGRIRALQSVQLLISPGEILFLTGVSGAGKTTLLRLLAGEINPSKGRITRPASKFAAQVFQDIRLIPNRTCEDNLWAAYDTNIYSSKNEFHDDLMELAKLFGIDDRLDLETAKANGGLKQKIAVIRALLSRPQVILADEPTSALDHANTLKLFEVLNFYNSKKGLTVIWASHNRELVKQFSGRIVHLDAGRLVYSGHACFI